MYAGCEAHTRTTIANLSVGNWQWNSTGANPTSLCQASSHRLACLVHMQLSLWYRLDTATSRRGWSVLSALGTCWCFRLIPKLDTLPLLSVRQQNLHKTTLKHKAEILKLYANILPSWNVNCLRTTSKCRLYISMSFYASVVTHHLKLEIKRIAYSGAAIPAGPITNQWC